jgi:hypothetical protein
MAKQEFYFTGKAAWVSRKPNKWGKFSFNFYPVDAAGRKAVKDTGIKNKVQEDDGSKSNVEGLFYTFRADTLYPITDATGADISDMIGNGSEVTVKLEVETFDSAEHGPQARSKVLGMVINKFIPYVKQEAKTEVPA